MNVQNNGQKIDTTHPLASEPGCLTKLFLRVQDLAFLVFSKLRTFFGNPPPLFTAQETDSLTSIRCEKSYLQPEKENHLSENLTEIFKKIFTHFAKQLKLSTTTNPISQHLEELFPKKNKEELFSGALSTLLVDLLFDLDNCYEQDETLLEELVSFFLPQQKPVEKTSTQSYFGSFWSKLFSKKTTNSFASLEPEIQHLLKQKVGIDPKKLERVALQIYPKLSVNGLMEELGGSVAAKNLVKALLHHLLNKEFKEHMPASGEKHPLKEFVALAMHEFNASFSDFLEEKNPLGKAVPELIELLLPLCAERLKEAILHIDTQKLIDDTFRETTLHLLGLQTTAKELAEAKRLFFSVKENILQRTLHAKDFEEALDYITLVYQLKEKPKTYEELRNQLLSPESQAKEEAFFQETLRTNQLFISSAYCHPIIKEGLDDEVDFLSKELLDALNSYFCDSFLKELILRVLQHPLYEEAIPKAQFPQLHAFEEKKLQKLLPFFRFFLRSYLHYTLKYQSSLLDSLTKKTEPIFIQQTLYQSLFPSLIEQLQKSLLYSLLEETLTQKTTQLTTETVENLVLPRFLDLTANHAASWNKQRIVQEINCCLQELALYQAAVQKQVALNTPEKVKESIRLFFSPKKEATQAVTKDFTQLLLHVALPFLDHLPPISNYLTNWLASLLERQLDPYKKDASFLETQLTTYLNTTFSTQEQIEELFAPKQTPPFSEEAWKASLNELTDWIYLLTETSTPAFISFFIKNFFDMKSFIRSTLGNFTKTVVLRTSAIHRSLLWRYLHLTSKALQQSLATSSHKITSHLSSEELYQEGPSQPPFFTSDLQRGVF